MIDVLTLNYNDSSTTISFVDSIKNFSCVRKILIVDNCSTDDSFEQLKKIESDKVVVVNSGRNGGYGAGNNFGIRYLKDFFNSEYILLSNPDVNVSENVLDEMEHFLRRNDSYSIVAPFMCNAVGKKQNMTAFRIPSKWEYLMSISVLFVKFIHTFCYSERDYNKNPVMDVGSVTGSLFLMRTDDMLKYGMYDENIFLFCEEVVLGMKIRNAGKKIGLFTNLTFIHNHSVSIKKTYKSLAVQKKILNKSKLFVLKKYYQMNVIEGFVAFLLAKLSVLEIMLVNVLKK